MAMAGHLLQLKHPVRWSLNSESLDSVKAARPKQCRASSSPISSMRFRGERLRHESVLLGGNSTGRDGFCKLGFGARASAASRGESEAREAEVVADEVDPEDNTNFPVEFKELIVDRGDPPNLYLYAAGLVVVVLMRHVILEELARWGINFARIGLYAAEGVTIGYSKLMDSGAEPIAVLTAVASWAATLASNVYTLIVDAPVGSLASTLFLSLAVLSIGDATMCKVKGSRSRLVSIAAATSVAGVLEVIPVDLMLFSLVALTAYASFIQKADLVTVFMPATVTFVAIASPLVRAAAFLLFLSTSVYANWRSAGESEQTPSESKTLLSPVFSAITATICISSSARFLYIRTVKWLLLRSA